MNAAQFVGAIRVPKATIAGLLAEKENAADWRPGIMLNFVFQAAVTLLFFTLAWLAVALLLGLGWGTEGHRGFFGTAASGFLLEHLSPLGVVLGFAKSLALVLVSGIGFAMILDLLFQHWYRQRGGESKKIFNVVTAVTLPWAVFMLIPVVGPLVAIVGSCLNAYRVVAAVYGDEDPMRNVLAMLAAGFGAGVAAFVVVMVVGAAIQPIQSADPFRHWTTGISDRAIFGGSVSAGEVMP